jgi:hypothetical protein
VRVRAPDQKFTYTKLEWKAIKGVCSGADELTISKFWRLPKLVSTRPDLAAKTQSLREALEELARDYGAPAKSLPRWQRAKTVQEKLTVLKAAHAALDRRSENEVREPLGALIDELQSRLNKLRAAGRKKKRRKLHTEYWSELATLFEAIGRPLEAKELIAFIHACSIPVFPNETEREGALRNFVSRFLSHHQQNEK